MPPAAVGVYLREDDAMTVGQPFSYWDGVRWCLSGKTAEEAARIKLPQLPKLFTGLGLARHSNER